MASVFLRYHPVDLRNAGLNLGLEVFRRSVFLATRGQKTATALVARVFLDCLLVMVG
jgi:hypothetical protein